MIQRFRLNAVLDIGFISTVSARALNVAIFISLIGFDHQAGMVPIAFVEVHDRSQSARQHQSGRADIKIWRKILRRARRDQIQVLLNLLEIIVSGEPSAHYSNM
jgi:hypothetical protein